MPSFLDLPHLIAFLRSLLWLSTWLVLLAVIFLPLEWLFAVHPRRVFSRKLAGDIGFYFISGLVPALLLAPPLTLAAMGAHALMPWRVLHFTATMPIWARALGALLVSEIGFYWGHRWAHQIPLLWKFHAVHHDPREVYFLVSARAHPVDSVFIRLCGLVPVYVLGLATPLTAEGGAVSAVLVLLFIVWGFLIHANIRWRFGPLEWLVSTPAFHHWHHTLSGPRDRNFASLLPVMDWVFGTFHLPRREWPKDYGIDTPLPGSVAAQLAHPFRPEPEAAQEESKKAVLF